MIRILLALGFVRIGKPYSRRNEQLVLFLRSCPTLVAPRSLKADAKVQGCPTQTTLML